jgi:hypothetical protein
MLEWLFVFTMLWIPIISLAHMKLSDYFVALPRYAVTMPFFLFLFIYKEYRELLVRRIFQVVCVFVAISAMSVPFQIFLGPIWFFDDASVRDGLVRYASLGGSLTDLGTLGVFSMSFIAFSGDFLFTPKIKALLLITTVLGMLLSLQKASIINLIIFLVLYILVGSNVKIGILKRLSFLVAIGFLGYGLYNQISQTVFGTYIGDIYQYTFSNSSLGTKADFLSRLWQRPYEVMVYNNIHFLGVITGIGFSALSGIMGLPNMPMSHNNYFDDLFSGGILHLISYILLLLRRPYNVIRRKINGVQLHHLEQSYAVLVILILINMLVGASTFYQPISSIFIYFTIFSYERTLVYSEGMLNLTQAKSI